MLPLAGATTFKTPLPVVYRQADQTLLHIERVSGRAGADQHDRCDVRRVGCLDLEGRAVSQGARCDAGYARTAGRTAIRSKQVCRRVDLDRLFV